MRQIYRDVMLWAAILIPLAGVVMAVRGKVWKWGAGVGFALWLVVQSVGNVIGHQLARAGTPTYPVGLATLVLQVGALLIALRGLTNDRAQHKRLTVAAVVYVVAFGLALLISDFSREEIRYFFRSPYTVFVAFGCGYAYIERTGNASLRFREDGARMALVGVLIAAVPVLLLEMVMYGLMAADEMAAALLVSLTRTTVLVIGYTFVALAFRNTWTFARSG